MSHADPNSMSQVTVIGRPQPKTWDDYEAGCLSTFGGGHRSDGHLDAFHHGMRTVFNLLRGEFPPAEQCKAAPDLLEACKDIRDFLRHNGYDIRIVDAAIAKAEGKD